MGEKKGEEKKGFVGKGVGWGGEKKEGRGVVFGFFGGLWGGGMFFFSRVFFFLGGKGGGVGEKKNPP
ncbi:hypothetical protein ACPCW1_19405, partial [Bacillus pumilus]|uniref:hypothetical protein n=1 Tax=Bacillus pumilus TaxID=1408 RepID=UPI003C15DF5E